ncbi:response regulator [Oscillatoriales cyanobacterium LEGE 11467]|uniref:Response regulator n=2 Tax=Zarconia TaxID=2992130 RepID=A0A928W051_9CYAN|nr:response regulator [Zarconia navalis LEGE 11467]
MPSEPSEQLLAQELPLNILLAEDIRVNQKVALRMFKRLGYDADLATNGKEVLEALHHKSYDIVFMDVQMPQMDGFEATRAIREEWQNDSRPWIIAMTANAMRGDREKCLEVGMNDYISKPIQLEAIKQALRQFGALS